MTANLSRNTSKFFPRIYSKLVNEEANRNSSSTEAEYIALATALTEVIWLKRLLEDFNIYNNNV